jgi:hypothetical protein
VSFKSHHCIPKYHILCKLRYCISKSPITEGISFQGLPKTHSAAARYRRIYIRTVSIQFVENLKVLIPISCAPFCTARTELWEIGANLLYK